MCRIEVTSYTLLTFANEEAAGARVCKNAMPTLNILILYDIMTTQYYIYVIISMYTTVAK